MYKRQRLCHVKVTGGALRAKAPLCYEAKGELLEEKADQVRVYTGGRFDTVQQVEAGAVCAVTGLSAAGPGAVLSAPGAARDALPGAKAPALAPVLAVQALLPPGADRSTALRCLRTLADEQPELDVQVQPNTGDILLHVMGTVQLEVCLLYTSSAEQKHLRLRVPVSGGALIHGGRGRDSLTSGERPPAGVRRAAARCRWKAPAGRRPRRGYCPCHIKRCLSAK